MSLNADLSEIEEQLASPCTRCNGEMGAKFNETFWCRMCGGSGLYRTIVWVMPNKYKSYLLVERYYPPPYLAGVVGVVEVLNDARED